LHDVVTAFGILNSIIFGALAVLGARRWRGRRDVAAG